jgi:acyl-CoA hydrolase
MRHAAGAVLTASIDRLDFLSPVHVGEIVVLQAQVNYVSRTSMEVGCRVETEDMQKRTRRYVTKAYLTFVAIDANGRPRPIAPLDLSSEDDQRRHAEAERRRKERLTAAGRGAKA